MLTKTNSSAVMGVDARIVEVEVNATGKGEEIAVAIVGLPDTAVRESRERIKSALSACGLPHPAGFTLINLAPADMRKEGAAFDLPIALAMLAAQNIIDPEILRRAMIVGELALDGTVRPVRGCLPMALLARDNKQDIDLMIVPETNAAEAAVAAAAGMRVCAVPTLTAAVEAVQGKYLQLSGDSAGLFAAPDWSSYPDFADVKGQFQAKRALEIAAAGGHNVLFVGPPGTGKSMLAKRLPGILPPMTERETLETSRIYSVMGLLDSGSPLMQTRPFRAPHHTVSDAGLLGGGTDPRPGEISLSHNGVLFLDELPEFKRNVLETLRQPMETGNITVSRAAGSFEFPSRFILLAAMNPCPCGHFGDPRHRCHCTSKRVSDYRARISGPLLDRIDLHVLVPALTEDELLNAPAGESSAMIRERVFRARIIQNKRFSGTAATCNARMEPAQVQRFCSVGPDEKKDLRNTVVQLGLSARAYDSILRVARTIADLSGSESIRMEHIYEAIGYRAMDRRL